VVVFTTHDVVWAVMVGVVVMLKVMVGVILHLHQLSCYHLKVSTKLTVAVACTPTSSVKVRWLAKGGESGSSPLLETRIKPQTPDTIWSFSISQVDVSGVPSGCRGMSVQVYSSPLSQFTNSMAATSSAHPVLTISVCPSRPELLLLTCELRDWSKRTVGSRVDKVLDMALVS
jgi:hypothetical protein